MISTLFALAFVILMLIVVYICDVLDKRFGGQRKR